MAILGNPWVVGIGTGIISGSLVFWLSRLLLSKKDNREYQQKLAAANREIIYAVRPGISEGHVPNRDVVVALIRSTARRNGAIESDLYTPKEIFEELIKEVMDSSFLSAAKKAEYCAQLTPLAVAPAAPKQESGPREISIKSIKRVGSEEFSRYRRRTAEMSSLLLATFAAITTAGAAIFAMRPQLSELGRHAANFLPVPAQCI